MNEVGAGNEVKKVRVKRREEREKQWERNRSQEEELKGMEAKGSSKDRRREKGCGGCYRGEREPEKGRR